jgi:hypothetical protein
MAGAEGLVAVSRGTYDQDEYDRQLTHGSPWHVAAVVPGAVSSSDTSARWAGQRGLT